MIIFFSQVKNLRPINFSMEQQTTTTHDLKDLKSKSLSPKFEPNTSFMGL